MSSSPVVKSSYLKIRHIVLIMYTRAELHIYPVVLLLIGTSYYGFSCTMFILEGIEVASVCCTKTLYSTNSNKICTCIFLSFLDIVCNSYLYYFNFCLKHYISGSFQQYIKSIILNCKMWDQILRILGIISFGLDLKDMHKKICDIVRGIFFYIIIDLLTR